jgi:TRAP transporter 4TM/12TM fusion protein
VVGTHFVGFLLFGVALTATGAAKFFLDVSLSLLGTVRGGTAKVAVFSSAMVGSISGSVVTNVITTGSFTIPAMKRAGYPSHYAGAIETCASTGGVLMPPIMVPAAIVPSLLYYFGIFVQVDCYAAKTGLKGIPREQLPSFLGAVKEGWFYVFAFIILIWFLFFKRLEAQAPFIAAVPLLLLSQIRKETRFTRKTFVDFLEKTSRVVAEIAGIMAAVGLLIGSLLLTGMAQTLSTTLIDLAGGNLYLLVGFGAIASFILGMGLTITACYLLLAVLLAPALVESGMYILGVHLFLMYCGMLSFITPPVAIAAYAAASLAGSPSMKTAVQACRMGAVLFILPFFFVFNPAFVLHASIGQIISIVGSGFIGVFLISSGIEGYLVFAGILGVAGRLLAVAGGMLLFIPGTITDLAGVVLGVIAFAINSAIKPKPAEAPEATS